jgi:hypothetical protein
MVAVAVLAMAACGGDDASVSYDAAVADAATIDAPEDVADAEPADAHAADASPPDAHVPPPPPDAHAPPDAHLPPDAHVPPPPPPDAGTGACDPVHQTGCGPGQKCDLGANGNFACVADGTLADFRVCDPARPNACVAGFTCRDTSFGDHRCARFCTVAEQDELCRSNEPCTSVRTTTDGHDYHMCRAPNACNPVLDDCLDASKQCTWNAPGAFCLAPGAVAPGGTCSSSAQCQRGASCIAGAPGQPMHCFKLCDPDAASPSCAPGVTCTFFATIGPQAIGACGYSTPLGPRLR